MLKNKYSSFIIIVALIGCFSTGCKKYLDIQPKKILIATKTSDYELLLNNDQLLSVYDPYIDYASDNYAPVYPPQNTTPQRNLYYWEPFIDADPVANPLFWTNYYRAVYGMNHILNNVMTSLEGSQQKKEQVYGEALAFRSAIFLSLLDIYSKPYDAATAAEDKGIPLISSTDIAAPAPARSSVQACFDKIVSDLHMAKAMVPDKPVTKLRPGKFGVYALLSRVYMNMRRYDSAGYYAQLALQDTDTKVLDYTTGSAATPTDASNTRTALNNTDLSGLNSSIWHFVTLPVSVSEIPAADLVNLYATGDRRFSLFFLASGSSYIINNFPVRLTGGLSKAEMMLNSGESLVREGKINEGLAVINSLRKLRIEPARYQDFTGTDKEQVLKWVLDERRRELMGRGLRWADMRRLMKEGRMPILKRVDDKGTTIATLNPTPEEYFFSIPQRVTNNNPAITN